jgi:hypothetical protein
MDPAQHVWDARRNYLIGLCMNLAGVILLFTPLRSEGHWLIGCGSALHWLTVILDHWLPDDEDP